MTAASNTAAKTGDGTGKAQQQPVEIPIGRVIPRGVSRQLERTLTGIDFSVDKTWDGKPIDHDPFTFHTEWFFQRQRGKPHKRVVKVFMEGPLFDDPDPPAELPGICPNLWDYEVVELFFANEKSQYLEVEVGPHGHWLVLLLNGVRKPFNNGEELELQVENTWEGDVWRSVFEIPLAYFPPNVTKYNAYAIHGSEPNRCYEALFPVTDGSHDAPDFHRLEYFKPIDISRIIPEGFNDHAFNDLFHGDLWSEAC